jgi:hypothetical protein
MIAKRGGGDWKPRRRQQKNVDHFQFFSSTFLGSKSLIQGLQSEQYPSMSCDSVPLLSNYCICCVVQPLHQRSRGCADGAVSPEYRGGLRRLQGRPREAQVGPEHQENNVGFRMVFIYLFIITGNR